MMKKILTTIAILVPIYFVAGLFFSPLIEIPANTIINMKTTSHFEVAQENLVMNGEINSRTLKQLNKVLEKNPHIKTLVLGNVPGSLDDDTMYQVGRLVREKGLNTHLRSNSHIASGGVDLFLSGVKRTMEDGAELGVHSWSDGFKQASDYPKNSPEHEGNRKYIEDMLGKDDFYWFTIYAAPADDILFMTHDQIQEYGLLTNS